MASRSVAEIFADTATALVESRDVTDTLAQIVADCADLLDAGAVGLMASNQHGDLELLASTSHRGTELELFQIQRAAGPCVDVIHAGLPLSVATDSDLKKTWAEVGDAIVAAGFSAVHAFPLRWHGIVLGGLNIFGSHGGHDDGWLSLAQAFADVATVSIVQVADVPLEELTTRVAAAVTARTAIEQAKGVLAYQHNLSPGDAYELLIHQARRGGTSLSDTAAAVIQDAQNRP